MGDNVSNPVDTGAIHGGALWQPPIQGVSDYDLVLAADVNGSWRPHARRALETLADWSQRRHHSPDTSGRRLLEITRTAPANARIAEIFEGIMRR